MHSTTFLGQVQGGRILTGQPLTDFEGKQVYVTLIAPDVPPRPVGVATEPTGSPILPRASEEAEILEDAGRLRMPPREVTDIRLRMVDVGRLPMRVYASDLED